MPTHGSDPDAWPDMPLAEAITDLCNAHALNPMTITRTLLSVTASVGAQAFDNMEPGVMPWKTFRRMLTATLDEDLRDARTLLRDPHTPTA